MLFGVFPVCANSEDVSKESINKYNDFIFNVFSVTKWRQTSNVQKKENRHFYKFISNAYSCSNAGNILTN